MKIMKLLSEKFTDKLSISDLNSLQLRTLKRLRDHDTDLDFASDRELYIIRDLQDLGLVDEEGELTDSGRSVFDGDGKIVAKADDDLMDIFDDVELGNFEDDDDLDYDDDDDDDVEYEDYKSAREPPEFPNGEFPNGRQVGWK